MATRTQAFDLLKGTAVVFMIQVHIIELIAAPHISVSLIGRGLLFLGGPPVAPVFALVLGYFLAASKRSTIELVERGLKVFCLGMLLNLALNLNLIIYVYKGIFKIDLLPYIFGVDILQFAGIAIIVIAALKKYLERSLALLIILVFVSVILSDLFINYVPENLFLKYISGFIYGSCSWSYFPLFPWLAYPLAGFVFYRIKQDLNLSLLNTIKAKVVFSVLFVVFLVITLAYAVSVSSDLQTYYHHGSVFFCWVIIFLSGYGFIINELEKLINSNFLLKYLKWLGKNVTLIYVIQWIIIGNVATEVYKTISSPLYIVITFVLVLIVASVIGYLSLLLKNQLLKNSNKNNITSS
jgi:uncharacterized membrane protein